MKEYTTKEIEDEAEMLKEKYGSDVGTLIEALEETLKTKCPLDICDGSGEIQKYAQVEDGAPMYQDGTEECPCRKD